MTDFKPCECGNQAEIHWSRDGKASWAKCDACGREGPVRLTETKAIIAWNKLPSERITGDKGRENPAEGASTFDWPQHFREAFAQPPAPQDDLVEAWRAARVAWCSGPGCQLTDEGHLRLGDEPAAVAVLTAYVAPIIAERDAALAKLEELKQAYVEQAFQNVELRAKLAAAEAALDPNETKAAYMGEFSFMLTQVDEEGEEFQQKVYVPWTTIKEIMAAIKVRAALATEKKP